MRLPSVKGKLQYQPLPRPELHFMFNNSLQYINIYYVLVVCFLGSLLLLVALPLLLVARLLIKPCFTRNMAGKNPPSAVDSQGRLRAGQLRGGTGWARQWASTTEAKHFEANMPPLFRSWRGPCS